MKKTFSKKIIIGLLAVLMVGGIFYASAVNALTNQEIEQEIKSLGQTIDKLSNQYNNSSDTGKLNLSNTISGLIQKQIDLHKQFQPPNQNAITQLENNKRLWGEAANDASQRLEEQKQHSQTESETGNNERFDEIRRRIAEIDSLLPSATNKDELLAERQRLQDEARTLVSKTEKRYEEREKEINTSCDWKDIPCWFRSLVSYIGQFFTEIFGLVLGLVGLGFDLSVKISITDLATYANSPGVMSAWTTLRDLANVFFIFILLYIAIGMILQLKGIDGRRMLVSVIIVALLINFSLFFTRIVIDASNVVAVQFFNAISNSGKTGGVFELGGISGTFMNALPMAKSIANTGGTFINTTAIAFGNVIMMIVTIFVFLTATILFVIRTVSLIMLMILSPLAFLMYAFPNQDKLFNKWWETLFNQAFFAPLYLIMVFVTVKILQSNSLATILKTGENAGFTIALHFMITIGFMFGAIIIAKSMGAKGASAAMKGAGALTGAAVGAVGWGTKKGLSVGWMSRNKEGMAQLEASRKVMFSQIGGGLKNIKNLNPLHPIKAAETIGKGLGFAEKKLPLGRPVGEFIRTPLKTISEGLAAVTKDQGIETGILGRTKDQEREKRKRDKDDKEAAKELALERVKREIAGLGIGTEDEKKLAKDKLQKIGEKDIVKIDQSSLERLAILLNDRQMAALDKEIDPAKFNKIKMAREMPLAMTLGYKKDEKEKIVLDSTKVVDEAQVREELGKMSHQTIAKLPNEWFEVPGMIRSVVADDIKEMKKAGVSSETIDKLTAAIKQIPNHPAQKYVTGSPVRGVPTSPPPKRPKSQAPLNQPDDESTGDDISE